MRHAPAILSRRQLLLLAGAAARLGASETDFWNSKPVAEWNAADKYKLANRSPWATPVQAWMGERFALSAGSRAGGHGVLLPEIAPWGPRGVVTWESAQPLRDVFKTRMPHAFSNCYVIGVDCIPVENEHDLDALRYYTTLKSKGRTKWSARPWVVEELVRNSVVYAFGFRKQDAPIDPESTLYFDSLFGPWQVAARFRPKFMLYRGQLAL